MTKIKKGDFVLHITTKKKMKVIGTIEEKALCQWKEPNKINLVSGIFPLSELEFLHDNSSVVVLKNKF